MLKLVGITKDYKVGDTSIEVLKGINVAFRRNEFVSILGQSGSGKTTMLNIIGGLDRYTTGDLIINGVSTKQYKDGDWDYYRNNSIGFIFQSYNLIPHQTVLANVELALTLAGVSKKERRERAIAVLEKVGLKDHIHKKPNQMSGGQMQRVAIARALINNPDILLADEPTGALDSETSVQIMELLKEIAKDKLVIMVTHNPELAEQYSTRIIRLLDGKITSDSDPYVKEAVKGRREKKRHKISMSFLTALSLSFNNLRTKKARTLLTAFAGSIGIIGIALILSLSTGFQEYIDQIQEDTLTSYPLTINSESGDPTSMLLSMTSEEDNTLENSDIVKENKFVATMFNNIGNNDLKSFKTYLDNNKKQVDDMVSMIHYTYAVTPQIYTQMEDEEIVKLNPSAFNDMMSSSMGGAASVMPMASASVFNEMLEIDGVEDEYHMLAGEWPDAYDEVLIVLSDEHEMSDMLVYGLGLRHPDDLMDMIMKIMQGEEVEDLSEPLEFTYDDLLGLKLRVINASDTYQYNEEYQVYESMEEEKAHMQNLWDQGMELKVSGVVCPKESGTMTLLPGVAYSKELTQYVIEQAETSEIVQKQLANKEINVFSNKRFDEKEETNSGLDFQDMISVDTELLSSAFGMDISEADIQNMTQGYMGEISSAITTDTSEAEKTFRDTLTTFTTDMLTKYWEEQKDPVTGMAMITAEQVEPLVSSYLESEEAKAKLSELETRYLVPKEVYVSTYQQIASGLLKGYITTIGTQAPINDMVITTLKEEMANQAVVQAAVKQMGSAMTEAVMQKTILTKVGELTQGLMGSLSNAFHLDADKIAQAFQFDLSEEELSRLMEAMQSAKEESSAKANLLTLGYQDVEEPSMISFYFENFEKKEAFTDFITAYNDRMEKEDEEKVLTYTDITQILISSVKTIVDNVSYILIAFVSISLVVSSIMIGIITYISVLERTKEIGILRSIGASKKDISRVFNAETIIVGLGAGLLGIGTTLLLLIPINAVIEHLSGIPDLAVLPVSGGVILTIISVILTVVAGFIPSKFASKKDPVEALRTE